MEAVETMRTREKDQETKKIEKNHPGTIPSSRHYITKLLEGILCDKEYFLSSTYDRLCAVTYRLCKNRSEAFDFIYDRDDT